MLVIRSCLLVALSTPGLRAWRPPPERPPRKINTKMAVTVRSARYSAACAFVFAHVPPATWPRLRRGLASLSRLSRLLQSLASGAACGDPGACRIEPGPSVDGVRADRPRVRS